MTRRAHRLRVVARQLHSIRLCAEFDRAFAGTTLVGALRLTPPQPPKDLP